MQELDPKGKMVIHKSRGILVLLFSLSEMKNILNRPISLDNFIFINFEFPLS